MWQSASTCVWQSPCAAIPRKSSAKRTLLPSTGTSCACITMWIAWFGLSGPATVLIGIAIETRRPLRTSPAASRTFAGVT